MTERALTDFRDALRSGDTAAAIEGFDSFDDVLGTFADRESAVRDVARGVIARTPANRPANDAAQTFLRAVMESQRARLECKNHFALHISGGPPASDVAEKVDGVIDAIETVQSAAETLRKRSDGVALPAIVELFGPGSVTAPKGSELSLRYTAANVGVRPTKDLDADVSDEGFTVSPGRIDTLEEGQEASINVSGVVESAGTHAIRITAGDASARTTVQVLDKGAYLERAIAVIESIQDTLVNDANSNRSEGSDANSESSGRDGSSNGYNGLDGKLTSAKKRLQRLVDGMNRDRNSGKNIDNEIRSVSRQISAFVNQVHGLAPQQISERRAAVLTQDAERVRRTLQIAVETEA